MRRLNRDLIHARYGPRPRRRNKRNWGAPQWGSGRHQNSALSGSGLAAALGGLLAREDADWEGSSPRRPDRRPPPPRWLRSAPRMAGVFVACALLAGGVTWLWQQGWVASAGQAVVSWLTDTSGQEGLAVHEVLVKGRNHASYAEIAAAVGVRKGEPILGFDPDAARRRLEALPWIRRAVVERRMPATIFIALTEREPMALWQRDGRLSLVDSNAEIIEGAGVERFTETLPLLVGDAAPVAWPALETILATQPALAQRVKAAVRVAGRRWNLRLDSGIDIRLPEEGVAEAWARLAELDEEHRLLDRAVVAVDLRLPDRLVLERGDPATNAFSPAAGQGASVPGPASGTGTDQGAAPSVLPQSARSD